MKKKKETKLVVKKEISLEKAKELDSMKKKVTGQSFIFSEEDKWEELAKVTQSKNKEDIKQKDKLLREIVSVYGLENGFWIASVDSFKYSSDLAKMKQDVTEEYDCKSASEFMLVDRIVSSYWRAMKYEKIINSFIGEEGKLSFTQLKINILKEVNRGLEMANRQFGNNIILLKEIKQPNLNIKVKADNAYFAQNQQINNKTDEESLKPNDLGKNI